MKKQEKTFFVQNLTEELKGAKSTYLVEYSGLTVAKQRELKKRLKEVGARFLVTKNTLFARAANIAKYPKEALTDTILKGQNALVLADEDPIKPLKVIADFAKEFVSAAGEAVPQIKVGVVEGHFANQDILANLAKLGGKEAIVSELIGMLMSPTYQLVATSQAKLQELIYVLNAKRGDS